jgi:hypothetical protein
MKPQHSKYSLAAYGTKLELSFGHKAMAIIEPLGANRDDIYNLIDTVNANTIAIYQIGQLAKKLTEIQEGLSDELDGTPDPKVVSGALEQIEKIADKIYNLVASVNGVTS